MGVIRKPAAAGRFYPRFKHEILDLIKDCYLDSDFGPGQNLTIGKKNQDVTRNVIGGISPHAGYVYSGCGTAFTLQEIVREGCPNTFIILGTQHTGYYDVGLMKEGAWETPLGRIEVDTQLAIKILENSSTIKEDDSAFNGFPHGREHNIEVQIPFIQYAAALAKQEVKIVPIKIGVMYENQLESVGNDIAKAIEMLSSEKDIAMIASSDMTHYQPKNPRNPKEEIFKEQYSRDNAVIEAFKNNNWKETFKNAQKTTVCGPQTISTLMIAANKMGYLKSTALKYYTSFEKTNQETPCDYSVGYFSGILSRI